MSELLNSLIFIVYSLLFWSAMAVGIIMTAAVGAALWNVLFRRH